MQTFIFFGGVVVIIIFLVGFLSYQKELQTQKQRQERKKSQNE